MSRLRSHGISDGRQDRSGDCLALLYAERPEQHDIAQEWETRLHQYSQGRVQHVHRDFPSRTDCTTVSLVEVFDDIKLLLKAQDTSTSSKSHTCTSLRDLQTDYQQMQLSHNDNYKEEFILSPYPSTSTPLPPKGWLMTYFLYALVSAGTY